MVPSAVSFLSKIKPTKAFKAPSDQNASPSNESLQPLPPQKEDPIAKNSKPTRIVQGSSFSEKRPPPQQRQPQQKAAPIKKKSQTKPQLSSRHYESKQDNDSRRASSQAAAVAASHRNSRSRNNNSNNSRALPSIGHKGSEDVRKYQLNIEQLRREPVQCDGKKALAALAAYRKHMQELIGKGERKPDMQVYKALRSTYLPERPRHGDILGVPTGLRLYGRGEAAILGIHCNILSGIDCYQGYPCYAVCLSGGYKDDKEQGNDKSVLYYTGEGGQDKKGKQVNHQTETKGNVSLMESHKRRTPIRVIIRDKGAVPFYIYEGIYHCTDWTYEKSQDGPKIYKFKLERMH